MATSGSRPAVSAAAVAGLMALAGAVLLAGCAPAVSATQADRPVPGIRALCRSRSPASVTATSVRAVPGSDREELVPMGISADGLTGYVSAWTAAFAGVAAVSVRTGKLAPIRRFADPAAEQADGAFGGRWLVWEQTYSLQSLDQFTVYGWDSASGAVIKLGQSLDSPRGQPWPSPWHAPAVSGSYAAWAQGDGPAGLVELRLADLRTGQVTVVARGHLQAPLFDGGLLVWPQSDRPGAQTTLHAYSLAAGKPAPLPVALRAVTGTDDVVADGSRTAYLNPALTGLYYSPAPGQRARLMLRLPAGTEFAQLSMGQGLLAWTTTKATYLASTTTGRYAQVTPAYGLAVTGQGPSALVADAPASGSPHPSLPLHALTTAQLAASGCTG